MSSETVIQVEGLGKTYIIGHEVERERYVALRDVLARTARGIWHKTRNISRGNAPVQGSVTEEFWALKDINFEIRRGEVVGIIGRNGAGKSTLLEILSRITEPTSGRATIRGRVASLLEVGTGFHPELTGRENIYLNGAILGMARAEIKRKFDEIVAFAGVERFLDTPVKRYSSGMYVRLAFAVAAHLEPDILVIDEVLAVGDAEFQKKCMGKMSEVAGQGRTVLFVSHNLAAVRTLCTRGILLKSGLLSVDSSAQNAVAAYLNDSIGNSNSFWSDPVGKGDEDVKLQSVSVYTARGKSGSIFSSDKILVEFVIRVFNPRSGLCSGFDLIDEDGSVLFRAYDTDVPEEAERIRQPGLYRLVCELPVGFLHGRTYGIAPRISIHYQKWIVQCDPLIDFSVEVDHGVTSYWATVDARTRPGYIAPIFPWKSEILSLKDVESSASS